MRTASPPGRDACESRGRPRTRADIDELRHVLRRVVRSIATHGTTLASLLHAHAGHGSSVRADLLVLGTNLYDHVEGVALVRSRGHAEISHEEVVALYDALDLAG